MAVQIMKRFEPGDDPWGTSKRSAEARRINRKSGEDAVHGWWENIGPEPIFIENKAHLKKVCQKHGVIPKMFIKPKSQGKGWEWTY